MRNSIIELLKDCVHPITLIHEGNNDEGKLLSRIDRMIDTLDNLCSCEIPAPALNKEMRATGKCLECRKSIKNL